MGKFQQQEQLLYDQLKKTGKITLAQATTLLGCSVSTVRRYFLDMQASGRAIRYHGGIQLIPNGPDSYSFERLEVVNIRQKQAIAAFAVHLPENGDTVYVDSGTTLLRFSELLAERLQSGELSGVTVVTNSLSNLNVLKQDARPVLIGGEFRENRRDFCGYLAEEMLKSLRFSKCFLGSEGYDPSFGFTTSDFSAARLNEIVLDNTERSYILMDSTKFEAAATVSFSRNRAVHMLITDAAPSRSIVKSLLHQNISLQIAEILND
jgi:DeoR family fructose operon transcriptional repressor